MSPSAQHKSLPLTKLTWIVWPECQTHRFVDLYLKSKITFIAIYVVKLIISCDRHFTKYNNHILLILFHGTQCGLSNRNEGVAAEMLEYAYITCREK
jgi:hypothetical protein